MPDRSALLVIGLICLSACNDPAPAPRSGEEAGAAGAASVAVPRPQDTVTTEQDSSQVAPVASGLDGNADPPQQKPAP